MNRISAEYRLILFSFIALMISHDDRSAWAGSSLRDCAECPEMIVLPAGRFQMGTPPAEVVSEGLSAKVAAREAPVHEVVFAKPFAVSRTEVTRDQFAAFVAATGWASGNGSR